jgi:DtxR family Mn-dependent transcriptional regulator
MVDPLLALLVAALLSGLGILFFWPRKGLLPRWRRERRMTQRMHSEDALKHIFKREMNGRSPSLESIAGTLNISMNDTALLLTEMEADGLLQLDQGDILLTENGREAALHIVRAHRLWERYLAEETGYEEAGWHERAEWLEHSLTPDDANALEARLGYPTHDPHGDPIPSPAGTLKGHGGQPLTKTPVASVARIVHLEDEPDLVYAQLIAEELHPGQIVHVTESSPERVRFWTNGNEHTLAPMVASNISVVPVESDETVETRDLATGLRLSDLEVGETAEVISITPTARGAERRRMLDLGILPGTVITAEMRSPGGDPTAYRIRGAVIALRDNQARLIKIKKPEAAA